MNKYDISLRPYYYASVSGGKDSLYMLKVILSYPDKYPLDAVVHFELEIDWDWVKNVIDYMESECNKRGIKFIRIKPRTSWHELYEKYDVPTRTVKWCNGMYKLDCKAQLYDWIKSLNCRPVGYIGFCADETSRFKYELESYIVGQDVVYPLAHEVIYESDILDWAKNVPVFDDWYKVFTRQGCMYCPSISYSELAYMRLKYPDKYYYFMSLVEKYEKRFGKNYFQTPKKYNVDYVRNVIESKYLPKITNSLRYSVS